MPSIREKHKVSVAISCAYTRTSPSEIIYDFTKESQLIQIELQKLEENVLIRLYLLSFC